MMNPSENVNGRRQEMTSLFLLSNVKPMENHPFQVRDDEEMDALVESIRQFGIEIYCVNLDDVIVNTLIAAQNRQNMVNA